MTAAFPRVRPRLVLREPPLSVVGVASMRPDALFAALVGRDDEVLARLSGVAAPGLIVVLGGEDDLPFVDGATWLGRDPAAPGLLLPTTLAPDVAAGLYADAVRSRAKASLVAVLPGPPLTLVPLDAARPLDRARLRDLRDLRDPRGGSS